MREMDLDKDDLFRNAAPGFVFILVVLSFYAISGQFKETFSDPFVSLLSIVAGFPLGFIIQSLHRIVFHILFKEKQSMQQAELGVFDALDETIKKLLEDRLQTVDGSSKHEKLAQWIAFSLDHCTNKQFRPRINFLNTYFQALGASSFAILLGLSLVFFLLWQKYFNLFCWKILATTLGWFIVALVFLYGRNKAKAEYELCRKLFIRLGKLVGDVQTL